jgi:predicted phage tail protein
VEAEPDEDVIQFVIYQLGGHRSRDEVVRTLCERRSWNWRQAERLVRRVEIEHHSKIAARQSPLVIGLGVGSVVVGAALIFYTAYLALNGEVGQYNPGIFVTGLAMVLGGIAGIWRAVRLVRGLD